MANIGMPVRLSCVRAAVTFFAAGFILLLMVQIATAHAVLLSSCPSQGERLSAIPATVTLQFSEAVTRADLALIAQGLPPIQLQTRMVGSTVAADLDRNLPDGVYALNWKVLSEDGHPVFAAIVFAVGMDGKLDVEFPVSAVKSPKAWPTWAAKTIFYLTSLFGVGAVFFAQWVVRGRPGHGVLICLIAAEISGLGVLALLGLELADKPFSALLTSEPWALALETSLERSIALATVAICLAAIGCLEQRFGRLWTLLSLVLIGPAYALTGHASAASTASFVAVALHIVGVCFWIGALPGLWLLLRSSRIETGPALTRFSVAIPISIATIIGAGGYLAYVQIASVGALFSTQYGKVFIIKLALVCMTLLLGGYNRLRLTPAVENGDAAASHRMRAIVGAEIMLVILVLSVTSLWRFTPPPRALALRPLITVSVHMHTPAAMATVSFEARSDQSFKVEVSVTTGDFDPLDPQELTLTMASTEGGVAPFKVPVQRRSVGFWTIDSIPLPKRADWNVKIDLLVSDFDVVRLEDHVNLPAE